jgi:Lhr-like helicase
MDKKYQPIVLNHASAIIDTLRETNFFVDYELKSEEYAMNYICEKLTEKFIQGGLNDEFGIELFSEDEIGKFFREIVAGSILMELQEKGIIDSIEDENNEERFFLTDLGKNLAKDINKHLENEEE